MAQIMEQSPETEVIYVDDRDDRVEQGILNISCNKMVYSENDAQSPMPPPPLDADGAEANRSLDGKVSDSQPADDVLLGVVIGCGMFFAFMLLGASVFIYCYCRAQRSAGSLGVRPRLSKIGDNWATSPAEAPAHRHFSPGDRTNSVGNNGGHAGGYILKNHHSSGKNYVSKTSSNKFSSSKKGDPKSTPFSKTPAGRNPSFDGESSFVDFDHESNRNSHEQSVESRHVVGECMLKLPEDRLHLLGNDSNLVCGEKTPPAKIVAAADDDDNTATLVNPSDVAASPTSHSNLPSPLVEPATADGKQQQMETATNSEDETALLLPVVVKCEVIASTDHQQQQLEVDDEEAGVAAQRASQTSTLTEASNIPHDDDEALACDSSVNTGVFVPASTSASSIKSTASDSPITTASVIYETLLINPPLSLTSNKSYHQGFYAGQDSTNVYVAVNSPSLSNCRLQQQQQQATSVTTDKQQQPNCVVGVPHRRFAPPPSSTKLINRNASEQRTDLSVDNHKTIISNNSSNPNTTQQLNRTSSKDSLSSVSGIIKLDIISAF